LLTCWLSTLREERREEGGGTREEGGGRIEEGGFVTPTALYCIKILFDLLADGEGWRREKDGEGGEGRKEEKEGGATNLIAGMDNELS
jgi:hypothetical protein